MGIQINGNTDNISATDGGLTVSDLEINQSGISTFNNALNIGTGSSIFSPATNVLTFGTNSNERLRIDSSGRMMIGTTAASTLASTDDLTISTSGSTGITLFSAAGNAGNITFGDGTSGDDRQRGLLQYHHSDNSMRFFTDAVRRMTIDSNGKVGIGTINPSVLLDVQGHAGSGSQTTIRSKSTAANASNFVRSESSDGLYIGLLKYGTGHSAYGALPAGGGAVYANSSVPITIMSDGGSGYINFATGGNTERLRIKSDGTIIFANKLTNSSSYTSHNTNFYGGDVNTGGVRIEVAHSTTSVSGNTASASFPHHLLLSNYSGTGSADNRMCSIGFDIPTTSTHANAVIAYQATAAGTGDLQFHLESGNSISEKLRITSNGSVLVNTTSGHGKFQVHDGTIVHSKPSGGGTRNYRFVNNNTAAGDYGIQISSTSGGSTYVNHTELKAGGDVHIHDGNLKLASGHGIDFSATGNGGSSPTGISELFSDYETGTFVVTLANSLSVNVQTKLTYTKIGNKCHISGQFRIGTGGSDLTINNLPFTTVNTGSNDSTFSVGNVGLYNVSMPSDGNASGEILTKTTKNDNNIYFVYNRHNNDPNSHTATANGYYTISHWYTVST